MTKYVPDILTRRWVLISPQRLAHFSQKKGPYCPFCPGHEKETPAEVLRFDAGLPAQAGDGHKSGWLLRVIPNKYPITDIHEVIIHSPHCNKDIPQLPFSQVELILKAYRERFNFHKKKGQVMIFCNFGDFAGASIKHPHSQIVVLPNQINIDVVVKEPIQNTIAENSFFTVYCPDFSQWPYEIWIVPKTENKVFGDISDKEIASLAETMQKMIKKLTHIYNKGIVSPFPFGYNFYIYPKENWYFRIIPRFVHRAGFELGTGLSVNIIDPQKAALELK